MTEWRGENRISLQGQVAGAPVLTHQNHGVDYYTVPLRVPRLSGAEDVLNLVTDRRQPECWITGQWLYVEGEVRSYNNRSGIGNRLVLTVYPLELLPPTGESCNHILLSGSLCKVPIFRRTPLGRSICDLMLAVPRRYGRADYLPAIAWGQLAVYTGDLQVGDSLCIDGRVQSRIYHKATEAGVEERVAYEVSVMHLLEDGEA